jgi:hypothetical protein
LLKLYLEVDTSDDGRIEFEEFEAAMPALTKKLGLPLPDDLEKEFEIVDKDAGGMILYDEFADYMMDHKVANPSQDVVKIGGAATSQRFSSKGGKAVYNVRRQASKSPGSIKSIKQEKKAKARASTAKKARESKTTKKSPRSSKITPKTKATPKKTTARSSRSPTLKKSAKKEGKKSSTGTSGISEAKIRKIIEDRCASLEEKILAQIASNHKEILAKLDALAAGGGGGVEDPEEEPAEEPAEEPEDAPEEPEDA